MTQITNMRALIILPTFLAASAAASVHLAIVDGGKTIGQAEYSSSLTPAGGRQTTLSMRFSTGSRKGSTVTESETVDSGGRQESASFTIAQGSRVFLRASVNFARNGDATIIALAGGKTQTKSIPAPKTASRRDLSEFWFIKSRPSPGTWVRYEHLSIGVMAWQQVRTTYVGKKPLTLAGRAMLANELTQAEAGRTETYWLDDQGQPLLIETGKTRLERRS